MDLNYTIKKQKSLVKLLATMSATVRQVSRPDSA